MLSLHYMVVYLVSYISDGIIDLPRKRYFAQQFYKEVELNNNSEMELIVVKDLSALIQVGIIHYMWEYYSLCNY